MTVNCLDISGITFSISGIRSTERTLTRVMLFQADCEVPLDSGIPVASIEHQHVVVETKESFTGTRD